MGSDVWNFLVDWFSFREVVWFFLGGGEKLWRGRREIDFWGEKQKKKVTHSSLETEPLNAKRCYHPLNDPTWSE